MPPSPEAFRDLLLELDSEGVTAFVAAVYAARGWAVDRDGDGLRVRASGERDWLRVVVAPDADRRPDADRVVVPAPAADADADGERVIGAATLLELVWYAVDADDRTRLFREFFDREPTAVGTRTGAADPGVGSDASRPAETADATTTPSVDAAETAESLSGADATVERPDDVAGGDGAARQTPRRRRLVAVAAILLVVGGVAAAVGPTLVSPGGDSSDGSGGSAVDGTVVPDTQLDDSEFDPVAIDADGRPITSNTPGSVSVDGPLPPGVTASGIENASALVDAHEAALDGRSYRLTVVAREFVGGRPTAVARERTVVEGPTQYRSDVYVVGTFRQEPRAVGSVSAYADGTTRFVRLTAGTGPEGTIRFTDRGGASGTTDGPGWRSVAIDRPDDPFADRTAAHLRRTLDVDDTAIVGSFERDGRTYVWIDLRRRQPGGNATIDSVLVDERGLVHEVRHAYALRSPELPTVRTVVTVRVEPANVTASPPPWL
jgi:hypothetical protein